MLKEVAGDILRSKAEMVAHGVAPNDGHANGLALSLRQEWPAMYKDFRHYCQTFSPKSGELWAWAGAGGTRIVSLFTQEPAPAMGLIPEKRRSKTSITVSKPSRSWWKVRRLRASLYLVLRQEWVDLIGKTSNRCLRNISDICPSRSMCTRPISRVCRRRRDDVTGTRMKRGVLSIGAA